MAKILVLMNALKLQHSIHQLLFQQVPREGCCGSAGCGFFKHLVIERPGGKPLDAPAHAPVDLCCLRPEPALLRLGHGKEGARAGLIAEPALVALPDQRWDCILHFYCARGAHACAQPAPGAGKSDHALKGCKALFGNLKMLFKLFHEGLLVV